MIDFQIRVTIDNEIASIRQQIAALPKETYDYFKSVTPIDTGNARRKTKLTGTTIRADYPYAEPLDRGHSKQALQGNPPGAGMTGPTEKWLNKRVKQIKGK